jgi:hypothetical protein
MINRSSSCNCSGSTSISTSDSNSTIAALIAIKDTPEQSHSSSISSFGSSSCNTCVRVCHECSRQHVEQHKAA